MTATMQPKSEAAEASRRGMRTPGAGQNARPRGHAMQFGHWWWALPGIALVFAIHYVATGVGGFFAFTNWTGIGSFKITGWANFETIFKDPTKLGALSNTVFLAFGSVLLGNIAGLIIALGLNRVVKTRYILRTLFFMPVVLSPLATAYIWKYIFEFDGPLNAFLTAIGAGDQAKPWLADPQWAIWTVLVVLVWSSTGFAMVIFMAGLAGVPVEVEEAAAIDGANLWQRFRNVTLPAIRPAVAIATTLGIVQGLRVFDPIMALTGGGPAGATETLATQVYKQAFALGNFGGGAALALVLAAIILFFAVIQQRLMRSNPED
ncbi:carbohydrate ABC transporter permease [Pseudarthrobacter sp. MM222]|uniref:carbohydrate ABC transporter permease n=1 Tax=Pseudarthrobacter sp. MM222 TaxID=3018929 RepID=UPI002220B068|nr:sugar ABC transporter permease [Pseudarthrobacter sp. MM222]CAI3804352.1 Melibiose/raffinose/stachyose import permease protein MelD [Pseudarthrobacter sp. MM222]